MTHPKLDVVDAMTIIARNTIAKARRWSSCACGEDRVRWDTEARRPVIDHEPTCPLGRARGEP